MKPEEIKRRMEELMQEINTENEALFMNYMENGALTSLAGGQVTDIKEGFRRIIVDGMSEEADEGLAVMAKAIVDAVFEVVGEMITDNTVGRYDDEHENCATCPNRNECKSGNILTLGDMKAN